MKTFTIKKTDNDNNNLENFNKAIDNAINDFILENHRMPEIIIINPVDFEKFIQAICQKYSYYGIQNFFNYKWLRIIRSYDIDEGCWAVY
jgi:threonine synthase